jgi:hypothetical protein
MTDDTPGQRQSDRRLLDSFERHLPKEPSATVAKKRNYRRNAARTLERFHRWGTGDRGGEG